MVSTHVRNSMELLSIKDIRLDGGTQPRAEIRQDWVSEYAEDMRGGAEFPPVAVYFDGKDRWLADGFHRVYAALEAGLDKIKASVVAGDKRAARLHSFKANGTHGNRRTNADKRHAVTQMLEDPEWAKWSDRKIAEACGVSHPFVIKLRGELSGNGYQMAPTSRLVERGGKVYEMETVGINDGRVPASELQAEPDLEWDEVPEEIEPTREQTTPAETPSRAAPRQADVVTLDDWKNLRPSARREVVTEAPVAGSFNQQTNASIEWAQWSWNPVTGCLHGCAYCYARDIAERFYAHKFVPALVPAKLHTPTAMRVPDRAKNDIAYKNVFTCSMADLFGKWVPQEWIEAVLAEVRAAPQWNFLFLTKFPQRLAEFNFPDNAWIGTSVDRQSAVARAEKAFASVNAKVKWLSCEPMLEPLTFSRLDIFQWIVIGGASSSTQTPAWRPPSTWISQLEDEAHGLGLKIYEKDNLRLREYPGGPRSVWLDKAPEPLWRTS